MKMEPLTVETEGGETATLYCTHREQWPPAHARLKKSFESLHAAGVIDDVKYQQLKTWQSTCGLMAMEASKCSTCPLALTPNDRGHLVPFIPNVEPKQRTPPSTRAVRGRDKR